MSNVFDTIVVLGAPYPKLISNYRVLSSNYSLSFFLFIQLHFLVLNIEAVTVIIIQCFLSAYFTQFFVTAEICKCMSGQL